MVDKGAKVLKSMVAVFSLLVGAAYAWRPAESRVKVEFRDRQEARRLEKLHLQGEFRTGGRASGFAILYADTAEMEKIAALGLRYSLQSLSGTGETAVGPEEVIAEMDRLAKTYPRICSKRVYGKSVKGNELSALKISDNAAIDENEPECLFDGGIHGDEFVGTDMLLKFAGELLAGYGKDAKLTELVNGREIWIYCMVNPDGRGVGRTNANGIDLNRDWGYMGADGFSQPETRAVRDCLLENRFALHITYHSGIEYLLYPWCFSGGAVPDRSGLALLADLYSTTSGYYSAAKNLQSYLDYPSTGETIDYSYGTQGTAALTMEITDEKGAGISARHYAANYPSLLKMIEYAGYGLRGTVTDAKTGLGVAAVIRVGNSFPVYSDHRLGDYHKFVPAGTYSITVTANGYQSQTIGGLAVKNESQTIMDISLQPDAALQSAFGHKVVFAEAGTGATPDALGPPDNKTFAGTLVLDMQMQVLNIPKEEIRVHAKSSGREFTCWAGAAPDGPWKVLGKASATKEFDLSAAGLEKARFLRIQGAAVDAVEAFGQTVVTRLGDIPWTRPARKTPGIRIEADGRLVLFHAVGDAPQSLELYDMRGGLLWRTGILPSDPAFRWLAKSSGNYLIRSGSGPEAHSVRFELK